MRGLSLISRVLVLLLSIGLGTPASAADRIVRTFTFNPSDVQVSSAENGLSWISMRGALPWGEVGSPEIPALSVYVDLPEGTRAISVTATPRRFVPLASDARVRPVQPPYTSSREYVSVDADPGAYASSDWTYAEGAFLNHSGSMRGRRLASVRLHPVQVRPSTGEIRMATEIEVSIELEDGHPGLRRARIVPEWEASFDRGFRGMVQRGPEAVRQGLDPTYSWQRPVPGAQIERFDDAFKAQPHAPTALPTVNGTPVRYLIITNELLEPTMDSLRVWKTEKGIPTALRTVEFIDANFPFGVDRAERIRLFIREAFLQWGTEYVLLAGDTKICPPRFGRTSFFGGEDIATDLYFTDLDGNWNADGDSLFGEGFFDVSQPGDNVDLFPDIYVGRAPIETPFEASIFLNKVLKYEQNPEPNFIQTAGWFAEVMFPQEWSMGQPISLDGADLAEDGIDRLSGLFSHVRLYENWMPKDSLGAMMLTAQTALDSMNTGYNLFYHGGHGFRNSMSMGDGPITNPDVTPLMNSPRTAGMMYSINCTSAAIEFESIGEEFVLAANGGSTSNVGSTHFDFPTTGQFYQTEFFNIVFEDSLRNLGAAQALQKLPFVGFAAFDNVHRWTQFTLIYLGDPEMPFRTVEPSNLTVSNPSSYSLSDTSFAVHVEIDGSPLAGARVCLLKDNEDYRVGTTDGSGDVVLPFRVATTGDIRLTVTQDNVYPFQVDVPVTVPGGVALTSDPATHVILDTGAGTNGNNNGLLDAGETVDLRLPVDNVGGSTSGTVTGTLLSLDSRATVLDGASSYGTISNGGSSNGDTYRIAVDDDDVIDGDVINLRLIISDSTGDDWSEDMHFTVRAPQLVKFSHVLTDNGNSDDFLDIGETGTYVVALANLDEGDARNVTAKLRAATSGVTVLDSTSTFGDIVGDGLVAGTSFSIQNNSQPDPKFELIVSDHYGERYRLVLDFVAPDPPTNIKGVGAASSISVVFTKSDSTDLQGYNIYRSVNEGGPYSKVNFVPTGRSAYFLDEGLAPLTPYYYYVTAVDSSGNESMQSETVSASTNPPTLTGFPIPMERATPSSPLGVDLDGDLDLEIIASADVLYAWHADGQGVLDADGTERTSGDFTTLGTYYAAAPAVADLDADGEKEIIAPTWDSKELFVFEPDGSVRTGFPVSLPVSVWSSPAVGNIDADPELEIMFNSNGNQFFAFNHDGTEVIDGDSNGGTLGVFFLLASSFNFGSPALANLDGDDELEILVPGVDGLLYAKNGDGSDVPGFPYASGGNITASPVVGDIDNDGKLEIAFLSTQNDVLHVIEDDGSVQFTTGGLAAGGNSRSPSCAFVDLTGDGDHEIVTVTTDGLISVREDNGTTVPGWSAVRWTEMTSSATESSPVAADLDADGNLEFLIGGEDGLLTCIDSNREIFPGFPIQLGGEIRGTPLVKDINQNGNANIILSNWDKTLYVWEYPGSGYTENEEREWRMFGHDNKRTNNQATVTVVAVNDIIPYYQINPIDGGVQLVWQLPVEVAQAGGAWRMFRVVGASEESPRQLAQVPEAYLPVGDQLIHVDDRGRIEFDDFTVVPGTQYSYVLARESSPGQETLVFGPYSVLSPDSAPERAFLAGAYPNPAGAGSQTIAFGVPSTVQVGTNVRLELYNVRGAKVRTLVNRRAEPGRFVVSWDGLDNAGNLAPGGVYLYKLSVGNQALTGRLVRLQQ